MGFSVIVVGGGITGVSTAEFLRREGVDVTLIDRHDPGDPKQASYGNAGLLAKSAILPISTPDLWKKIPGFLFKKNSPLSIKWSYLPRLLPWLIPFLKNGRIQNFLSTVSALQELTHDSVDQHFLLAQGTEAEKYIKVGPWTFLYPNELSYLADNFGNNLREKYGYKHKKLNRNQLLKNDPFIGTHYNYGAMFENHGWLTSPGNYMIALAKNFKDNGGKFIKDEIKKISGKTLISKNGNRYNSDKIVFCTGAWSAELLNDNNHFINLETERGYHLFLKGVNFMPNDPYVVSDSNFAITPMNDGLRCAGTVEFAGLKEKPSQIRVDIFREGIKKLYPKLKWSSEEIWMGHRPTTTDSLPVIGESKKIKGIYFAFGGQHIGLTIGPRLGRIITDLIIGKKTNIDLNPYRHNRF